MIGQTRRKAKGNMLDVFIADDEINICSLIHSLIEWDALDLSFAGAAYTGTDAYARICALKPDIAILDIKMPGMDGLEIVRRCQDEGLNVRFLLVSGHKNFDYAYTALKYGVEKYLLKPINKRDLQENLIQLCDQIHAERAECQNRQSLAEKAQKGVELGRQQFLNGLYYGTLDEKLLTSLPAINAMYNMRLQDGCFTLLAVRPDSKVACEKKQVDMLLGKLAAYFERELEGVFHEYACIRTIRDVIILLNYTDAPSMMAIMERLFERARIHFFPYCLITLGFAAEAKEIPLLKPKEAECAVLFRLSLGCERIIEFSRCRFVARQIRNSDSNNVFDAVYDTLSIAPMEQWLEKTRETLLLVDTDPWLAYHDLLRICMDQTARLRTFMPDNEIEAMNSAHSFALSNARTKEELLSVFREIICGCLECLPIHQKEVYSQYVLRAKQYVQQNYEKNVSLEDVSKVLYLHPSYFSSLFKKEEGCNFSEYLTQYRITKSKELLKDPRLNISEVGKMVGYQDAKYFSKVFFRVTGIKPSDYRKLH